MNQTFTITEAKANLSAILTAIEEHGHSVTICRGKKPVAELRPSSNQARKGIKLGAYKEGEIRMADDFDVWPEDIQRALHMID